MSVPESSEVKRLPEVERGHGSWRPPGHEGLRVQLEAALQPVPDDPDLVPRVQGDRPANSSRAHLNMAYFCLRSRPVDPNVVCPSVRL